MPSPDPFFEAVLRPANGVYSTDEPLPVEVMISGVLVTFDGPLIDVADPVDYLGQRFVTYLVGKRSPDALALGTASPHVPTCRWRHRLEQGSRPSGRPGEPIRRSRFGSADIGSWTRGHRSTTRSYRLYSFNRGPMK